MKHLTIADQSDTLKIEESTADKVRIEFINAEKSFYKLSARWDELAAVAGSPVYMTFEWISTWWKHFGKHPKRSPFILAIYSDEQLIGIAPFYKGESSLGPVTLQTRLHLMGCGVSPNEMFGFSDDYGYSDFLDIIVHPDYEDPVADFLATFLKQNKMEADVVCFQQVSDESFVVRKMLPRLKEQQLDYELERTDECPFITLPDSMETYLEEIGSSSRRRRFRKNLEPAGKKYELEEVSSIERVREGIEILYKLHQERWNELGYPGAFFDTRYYNFIKDISEIAFKKGWLWFKIAKDEEGVAAVRWTLNYNNRFFDCITAFDISSPSAEYSPGLGLLAVLIEDAIEMNASRIELLRGTERYKFDFTKKSRYNWRISLNFYREKSKFRSFLGSMINGAAKLFSILENEWELLRVHREKAGLLKMFYSYGSFRTKRLKSKLDQADIF